MKTLIRVQNSAEYGMFTAPLNVYYIRELTDLAKRHRDLPNLYSDDTIYNYLLNRDELDYRFAFKSITQFEKWVLREEVKILKEYGFRVVKINVNEVCESEFQAVFNINTVESIEDITELFID